MLLSAYRSYNRDSLTTFWQPRVECDSERHAEARRRVDAMSTSHEEIKLIKYSPQKEDIFRRIKENIGLPGDSGRIGVRTMCHTRWTIKVDALGSITSNCTVLRSTPDDAKDVDRARYGDEGKNSRHFVSNEQIPLPVRDHIGRAILLKHANNLSWNLQHTSLLPRRSTIKSGVGPTWMRLWRRSMESGATNK